MEKITFTIYRHRSFCRIEAREIRRNVRKLSDGACICSMTSLFDEMQRIIDEGKQMGLEVTFELYDVRN